MLELNTKHGIFLVDEEDVSLVKNFGWFSHKAGRNYYARAYDPKSVLLSKKIYLHRLLMGARSGELVDHIDGNTFNNSKANLRLVNKSINAINSKRAPGLSGLVGVAKSGAGWEASIRFNGNRLRRVFDSLEDAKKQRKDWENVFHNGLRCV